MTETRLAYLRPEQVQQRLARYPVIYVPWGPIEWHGPHLPFGVDPLIAQAVALKACQRTGGLVWPTQFWGTERERSPRQLRALGFEPDQYVVGMDFPANTLPSGYCPEEVFGLVVRETLREVQIFGARLAVLVNGHGAANHWHVLQRLAVEFNHGRALRVYPRLAVLGSMPEDASLGHASAMETSLMMHLHAPTVDLTALPPLPEPMRYADFAIVDGPGFDGTGSADRIVQEDPRTLSSAEEGRDLTEQISDELAREVNDLMKDLV